MDTSQLIGLFIAPVVVGAIVSGLVSLIVSRRTNDLARAKLESEDELGKARLAQEKALGEQRLTQELSLAEQRIAADTKLAERKAALERQSAIDDAKRVFAEDILSDFYKARNILFESRTSWLKKRKISSRARQPDETETTAKDLDDIYAPYERLAEESDFFADLRARKFRLMALIGAHAGQPFDDINDIISTMVKATDEAILGYETITEEEFDRNRLILGINAGDEDDPLEPVIANAITTIEAICRPLIEQTDRGA